MVDAPIEYMPEKLMFNVICNVICIACCGFLARPLVNVQESDCIIPCSLYNRQL